MKHFTYASVLVVVILFMLFTDRITNDTALICAFLTSIAQMLSFIYERLLQIK